MIIINSKGGFGRRFKEAGILVQKLDKRFGRSIIWHLISNLNIKKPYFIIPYNKEYKKYNFEELLRKNFPKINFIFVLLQERFRESRPNQYQCT